MRHPLRRREAREFLDRTGHDPRELDGVLADLRRVNRWYGGRRLVLRYLEAIVPRIARRPLTVLDVATGSADIPHAVARWARRRGVSARIVALDHSAQILAVARREIRGRPEIALVRGDARALPFPDRTVDIVLCGLTLHHFTEVEAARVLREIDRVAREAFVVHDLLRSWRAYAGAWLQTRLQTRNRLSRHDGPLSVLRSFTLPEIRAVVALAGVGGVEIRAHPLFRVALVRRSME